MCGCFFCSFSEVKPSPPVNLSHIQTIEAELILRWDDPSDFKAGPLRHEVRYSSNTTHPAWQVTLSTGEILPSTFYLLGVIIVKILIPHYNKAPYLKSFYSIKGFIDFFFLNN